MLWSDNQSDLILDNFREYALHERKQFQVTPSPDLGDIIGGEKALRDLLHLEPDVAGTLEIYSEAPLKAARRIADEYYKQHSNPLTYVNTTLATREFEIFCGNRILCRVYVEGTSAATYITKNGLRYVSPKLQLADLMRRYYIPQEYENRAKIAEVMRKLCDNYRIDWSTDEKSVALSLPDPKIFRDMILVHTTPRHIILISSLTPEDIRELIIGAHKVSVDIHNIRLPKEFLTRKVTTNIKGIRYSIYPEGYYDMIPYRSAMVDGVLCKVAIDAVRCRVMLIEDNTTQSLLKAGILRTAHYIAVKSVFDSAMTETYPPPTDFYGEYRDRNVEKKIIIRDAQQRFPYYFPAIGETRGDT